MIIFDELAYAEEMNKKGFIKCFSIYELSIYAKWKKFLGLDKNKIEEELIDFSKKNNKDFVYDIDYPKIDAALKSIDEYRLRTTISTNITENEIKTILSLDNKIYCKALFIMLVVSKYYKNNNIKIVKDDEEINDKNKDVYFCKLSDAEISELAGVRFRETSERNKMFGYFYDKGLNDVTTGKKCTRIVKYVDDNSPVVITVNDYDHIILYYDKYIGDKIGECKKCGKLFKQGKKNNADYCYNHREYQKQETKTIICIDCGEEFSVDARNMTKTRCDYCQEIYRKKYKASKEKERRNNMKL